MSNGAAAEGADMTTSTTPTIEYHEVPEGMVPAEIHNAVWVDGAKPRTEVPTNAGYIDGYDPRAGFAHPHPVWRRTRSADGPFWIYEQARIED